MDTEDEEARLTRELRINRLKEQIRASKARQLTTRLPGIAIASILTCAGVAVVVIVAIAMKRILM